jgi:hypothetical protein
MDAPPDLLTNASVHASWATLADFSGNMPALDRWLPPSCSAVSHDSHDSASRTARGASVTVDMDGQRLHIRYAAAATIDQLMTGSSEAIADAQSAFAEQLAPSAELHDYASITPGLQIDASLYSATSDGSISSVSVG